MTTMINARITAAVQAEYLPGTGAIRSIGPLLYEGADADWVADRLNEHDGLLVSTVHQLSNWGRWTRLVRFDHASTLGGTYWLIAEEVAA